MKYSQLFKILCFVLFCCGIMKDGTAQFYNGSQLSFGKNRVQYQEQNWQYYRTNQFDVYFYPTGKALAEYTLAKVPQMIEEVERLLNFPSSKKLQFIVYNTQADFRESNFAYDNDNFYNQGGVTNIYGTKIYLYFDGNHAHFDRMIKSGIMNIYAHWVIDGMSLGANISSESLLDVPNWYYSGLSSYVGEKWNSTLDAYVKNGILTQRYAVFDELSPVDATYAGHSFWRFIVDRYGESSIPAILYATRSYRSHERGFLYVTGVPFKQLLINWYRYYYVMYSKDVKRDKPDGDLVLAKTKRTRHYNQFRLSPNGENFAFVTNEAGKISIWLHDSTTHQPKKIFRRYQKTEDNPDLSYPLIAWHPSNQILGFTIEDAGRCYYYPYNIETQKLEKRILIDVEKITDISFSDDGKLLLFSGFKNGQSDIFVFSLRARSYQNLTNDFYDDYAPRFFNHQKQIVFSSNRPNNQINRKEHFAQTMPQSHYDLFLYDYETKNDELMQITFTPYGNESNVREVNENSIVFLSDENGMNNRFMAQFDSTISKIDTIIHYAYYAQSVPITDCAYSILEQDFIADRAEIAEIVLHKGSHKMYRKPWNPQVKPLKLELSSWQQQMKTEQMKEDSIANARREEKKGTTRKHGFYQVKKSDISANRPFLMSTDSTSADTNAFSRVAARNYYTQFSINQVVTQADFSFLNTSYQQFTGGISPIYLNTGMNALIMFGINDLFEDYRITGGFRLSFDLMSNEFMFSYEDLSKRLDHQLVLYRQSIKSTLSDYYCKQYSNSVFYIMKFPFNKFNSLRLTLTGRYETYVTAALNDVSLKAKDEKHGWGGVKLEYIFDSSKELYTNLWRGTKMKIFAEYQHRIDKDNKNLLVLGFDARKSVKVFRNMTWATRIAASTNFGSSRLVYYMGGMDNWIFAKFDNSIWVDQSKDYAYQTLATNMRGFKQNIRNGTSFALISTELRIPFVQLIAKKQVSKSFFNSLQLIVFGDFGTAWTGKTPYAEDNCLYTRYVNSGDISVKVKRQVEPFIGGFGLGLRAKLFGYFVRVDYAWGVEDYKIIDKRGMFLLSLGLDF